MLNVIMLSVVMLNLVMLSVIALREFGFDFVHRQALAGRPTWAEFSTLEDADCKEYTLHIAAYNTT